MNPVTKPYRTPAGKYFFTLMRVYLSGWWTGLFALLAAAGIVCGIIFDLRYLILALMLLLIVAPATLVLVYVNHGMHRLSSLNILPHTVSFGEDALTVEARIEERPSTDEEELEPTVRLVRVNAPYAALRRVKAGMSAMILAFGPPEAGMLTVPYREFESQEACDAAFGKLRNKKNNLK